jgi:hypothetical protein
VDGLASKVSGFDFCEGGKLCGGHGSFG